MAMGHTRPVPHRGGPQGRLRGRCAQDTHDERGLGRAVLPSADRPRRLLTACVPRRDPGRSALEANAERRAAPGRAQPGTAGVTAREGTGGYRLFFNSAQYSI